MGEYFHSVCLLSDRCKGCVNCIKRCPTEAIRIRGGKAQITETRCIDCGECIRRCANHAKTAVTDCLDGIRQYRYNIALPAPALYAQFSADTPIESILCALLRLGFDEVFEVARAAEFVSLGIREYLQRPDIKHPAISSACPAVVRLIQVKFPELIDHLIPIDAPVDVAARIARSEAGRKYNIPPEDVGIWFITPCPAKMTAVKQPLGTEKSNVSGAIGIAKIYGDLLKNLPDQPDILLRQRASWTGIGWAVSGGENTAVDVANSLVVEGVGDVSQMLEQVSLGKLNHVDHIEALACAGGCIGGPLTVENRFVALHRMQQRIRKMIADNAGQGKLPPLGDLDAVLGVAERRAIEPRPILRLDENVFKAMYKVELMEKTLKNLPGLDCGSCGSPNCKALAEDIVQGTASETDCIFKLREKVRDLAQEMVKLAEKLPPSLPNE